MTNPLYYQTANDMTEKISSGVFLTVKDRDGKLNTMTIGWATIGYMWMRPVMMVMVRKIRETYHLMENTEEFTVSIPLKGQYKKELLICGTKSARDIDKFKECKLEPEYIENFSTPVIKGCELHYLCKIVFKQHMNPEHMSDELNDVYGPEQELHTLYFGEIMQTIQQA
jgi:flavin reductase (DIM6/NTAB) family NADH-FMN oxidoreductase RutF